jgi:hypothetical protein
MAGTGVIVGTIPGLGSLFGDTERGRALIRLVYAGLQRFACGGPGMTVFQNHASLKEFTERGITRPDRAAVILGSGVRTRT